MTIPKFTAVILAGDRNDQDPVAAVAGVSGKSIVPVAGIPMILRVITAIEASRTADNILICGPAQNVIADCPALQNIIDDGRVSWLPPGSSPCDSANRCIDRVDLSTPLLLTTADHALLKPEMLVYFLEHSIRKNADATVALVSHDSVKAHYPDSRRTNIKFKNGNYCGCNLFALFNERGKKLISIWKQVEQNRKHPFKILGGLLGPLNLIYFLLGRLTINDALHSLTDRYDIVADFVPLPFPEAGIDVDTVADFNLAESLLSADLESSREKN